MNPISILTAATSANKAVISLLTGIYNFINSAKNADRNVQGLQSEAFALNAILEAIKRVLSNHPQPQNNQLRDHKSNLWAAILISLQCCERTVRKFRSLVNTVGNRSANVVKTISMKFREDQLNRLRKQSRSGSEIGRIMKPQTKARIEEWIGIYDSEAGSKVVDLSSTASDCRWTPHTSEAASSEFTVAKNGLNLEDDAGDVDYYESLSLLSLVVEGKDNMASAETYRFMIADSITVTKPKAPKTIPISPSDNVTALEQLSNEYFHALRLNHYNADEVLYWSCGITDQVENQIMCPPVTHLLLSGWSPQRYPHDLPSDIKLVATKPTFEDVNFGGEYLLNMLYAVMVKIGVSEVAQKIRQTAELLIQAGADVNATNQSGLKILAYSSILHLSAFDLILKAKGDFYSQDNRGQTPLHFVATSTTTEGSYPAIVALLEAGADPRAVTVMET